MEELKLSDNLAKVIEHYMRHSQSCSWIPVLKSTSETKILYDTDAMSAVWCTMVE